MTISQNEISRIIGVDIDHRPLMADKRQRIGDYEGDTVVGKNHKGVLFTLVDNETSALMPRRWIVLTSKIAGFLSSIHCVEIKM